MARSTATKPETKPTTAQAEIPASPPVTFTLEKVEEIVREALKKQADAFAVPMMGQQQAKTANGKSEQSLKNEIQTVRAFKKAGFGNVKVHEDVRTFKRWLAVGMRPVEGSKALKIGGFRLFHKTQCRPITAEERKAMTEQSAAAVKRHEAKVIPIGEGASQ
jgi:hypothetical protein